MTEKESRLHALLERGGHDGALLSRRANIAWLTDGADTHVDCSSRHGIARVLWTPHRKIVFTTNIEEARLAEEEFDDGWEIHAGDWWTGDPAHPEGRWLDDAAEDPVAPLRWSLTDREIETARRLGRDSAEVMQHAMHAVRPGWTEHELAGEIVGALRKRGIFTPVMLVAADDRITRYRHPIPTERRIERTVMAAICAQRRGLTVSVTRLVRFGEMDDDLRRRHEAVCAVDKVLHDATRPGTRWCDALRAATDAYAATGFADEWKRHHQGGPMGYELRDFVATPTEQRTVQPNQLVGWNPSITGTKSEDTILSTGEIVTPMDDWPTCNNRPDILTRAV